MAHNANKFFNGHVIMMLRVEGTVKFFLHTNRALSFDTS